MVLTADFAERDLRAQQWRQRSDAAARDVFEQSGPVDADAAESQDFNPPSPPYQGGIMRLP